VTVNYKPVVAVMFAIILLVAGIWSSKRRPWKGGKERMAVVKTFAIISLPFVLLETATGVISFLTGELSIPPLLGVGTAIDLIILFAGVAAAALRLLKTKKPRDDETNKADSP
jgi:heme A synthase